jgi:hypothetical protein
MSTILATGKNILTELLLILLIAAYCDLALGSLWCLSRIGWWNIELDRVENELLRNKEDIRLT